jgi:hypothetical protein
LNPDPLDVAARDELARRCHCAERANRARNTPETRLSFFVLNAFDGRGD